MIREATVDEVPILAELGGRMHAESPAWSRMTYCPARAADMLRSLIERDHGAVFVAEYQGKIVGGIACHIGPHWACLDYIATELSLFVHPAYRTGTTGARLIARFKEWAYDQGAVLVLAGTTTGVRTEGCIKLYERLGFKQAGAGLELFFGRN